MQPQIILASASPRRMELLDQIKVIYHVHPVDLDESVLPGEAPLHYVQRVAAEKSAACARQLARAVPVLAADTSVVVDGVILGKPKDQDDALAMLSLLSGRTHQVYSAVSLLGQTHGQAVSITDVTFRSLTDAEMLAYWQSGEAEDKAGSYGIQGQAAVFIAAISGSYSGVMGLPLFETAQLLSEQGIEFFS